MRKIHYNIYCVLLLGFILGIHNGNVALWKDNSEKPVEIFSIPADALPEADQRALAKGIRIENKEVLLERLEDYLS